MSFSIPPWGPGSCVTPPRPASQEVSGTSTPEHLCVQSSYPSVPCALPLLQREDTLHWALRPFRFHMGLSVE